jgi:hypothetical protein
LCGEQWIGPAATLHRTPYPGRQLRNIRTFKGGGENRHPTAIDGG